MMWDEVCYNFVDCVLEIGSLMIGYLIAIVLGLGILVTVIDWIAKRWRR